MAVAAKFKTDEPIEVYGLNSLKMIVDVDSSIRYGGMYFNLSLQNISGADVYLPSINVDDEVIRVYENKAGSSDVSELEAVEKKVNLLGKYLQNAQGYSIRMNPSAVLERLAPNEKFTKKYVCYNSVTSKDIAYLREAVSEIADNYGLQIEINTVNMNHYDSDNADDKAQSIWTDPSKAAMFRYFIHSENFRYYINAMADDDDWLKKASEALYQGLDAALNFDFEAEEKQVVARLKSLLEKYANLDIDIDKEVFTALLREYREEVPAKYLPPMYQTIDTLYNGNEQAYIDTLYARSEITSPRGLKRFLERDTTFNIIDDPAISLGIDLIVAYYDMNHAVVEASEKIERDERLFNAAVRRMYADRNFYPDANSTMRLSFGTVCSYSPFNGAVYNYYTTPMGIFEKMRDHQGDPDFEVSPRLLELFSAGDFGRYADEKGEMKVCFISNNDITGGNSGSAMFNAKGELLGLAFDGNWEAMSSDIVFEPDLQRCIDVDVRYMLFIIEKYGGAANLIKELKINGSK